MRILVIRTSAMGDVVLTTPVLRALNIEFPEAEIIMMTRPAFTPFFSSLKGITLFTPDFKGRHEGVTGLFRLRKELLKQGRIDYIIDIHDVIRTKILRFLFRAGGVPVSVIDKGRKEKRALIRGKRKIQLKHTVDRYRDAFEVAGFKIEPIRGKSILVSAAEEERALQTIGSSGSNIGIAPYAKHQLKTWPEEYMVRLLNLVSQKYKVRFWLFGGKEEEGRLRNLEKIVKGATNLSGKLSLGEELAVIEKLDFMISMDSSNMHMAALTGTKVISIWGGTDPLNGFGAWMQPDNYSIRIPITELTCRPCTTYGKGRCKRGDLACLEWLTPEIVFNRLEQLNLL